MTKGIDLKETYLQNKNIRDYMIIPKHASSPKEEIRNATDLKHLLRNFTKNTKISLQGLNKALPVLFIYQDVAYFSCDLNPELLNIKQINVLLKTYSKDRMDLNRLLKYGLLIFDLENMDRSTFVYMDRKNQIILFVDRLNAKEKFGKPIKEFKNLDEDCNISDELYNIFFNIKDTDEDNNYEEEDVTKFDEEYFDLMEEYGEEYEEYY